MTMTVQDNEKWQEAFIRFGLDASLGRLFKGIIHNLNGVGQAFSMQTELLAMTFVQADKQLAEVGRATSLEEALGKSAELREMLGRRADLIKLLTGKVQVLQDTLQRTHGLTTAVDDQIGGQPFTLESVILTELEFLNADGFFKHKIRKELALAENLPALAAHRVEIHQILAVLLENAAQALAVNLDHQPEPLISITTGSDGDYLEVRISDNGPGIAAGELEKIFEPFFTTRTDHLGLGLYLARVLAGRSGGSLACVSSGGRTCFVLRLPVGEAKLAG
jgi:signal transduction histidine kinase